MANCTVLAVDIGAESGRAISVRFDGQRLTTQESYRFANVPVQVGNTLYWDILRLWNDVQTGVGKAGGIASIGLDTWAVDFAFLDRAGHLLGNPVHYRDRRTEGMSEYVFAKVARSDLFTETGIQHMEINSIFQLTSLVKNNDPALECATTFLTVPDLLYFWLTGVKVNEFTNATTTECYNPRKRAWATDVLEKLAIPTRLFGEVGQPGQILREAGRIAVVLGAGRDMGVAVV